MSEEKYPLVLLHGALGSERQVAFLQEALQNHTNVFSLTFSGHGGLAYNGAYSFELFQNDILNLLETHGIQKANFFGYSMGGYAALYLALNQPQKVNSIFTLGTKLQWDSESAQREVKFLNPDKMEEKVPEFASFLKKVHAPEDWKLVMGKTANLMLNLGESAVIADDQYKQIQHPVMLTVGDLDNTAGVESTKEVTALMQNAVNKVFPNTPHPLEKIDRVLLINEILKYFRY